MIIAILYSLPTKRARRSPYLTTEEDTVASAQKIANALMAKGAEVPLVPLSENSIKTTIRNIRADMIINLVEWTGEDFPLSIIAMEELTVCGIPYSGATKENYMLTDKVLMKKALDRAGLPTPRWQTFLSGHEGITTDFTYPVIVKLSREHCSVGIDKASFVANETELKAVVVRRLKKFHQEVYAEEFISGREFQITVMERDRGPVMLPVAEIIYKPSDRPEFLTFSERWHEADPDYHRSATSLAVLSESQNRMFERISLATFRVLGFRDYARVDARLKNENDLMILEANPNPGLDDDEQYSMTISAKAAGLAFPDFLWEIVRSVIRRTKKA